MAKLSKVKQAIKDRASSILAEMEDRQPVTGDADHQFILDLLSRHPDAAEKIGSGIDAFICLVMHSGDKCFGIIRRDGSEARFSTKTCLTPPTARANFQAAFRQVVSDQSLDFYAEYKDQTPEEERVCPITGEAITDENHAVDHCGPLFSKILDDWVALHGIDIQAVAFEKHPTRDMYFRPKEYSLRKSFEDFHKERAMLRVLTKRGNGIVEARRRASLD